MINARLNSSMSMTSLGGQAQAQGQGGLSLGLPALPNTPGAGSNQSTRRTSLSLLPNVLDELRGCMPAELFGHNIAVSCGHCVILIKSSNGTVRVVAGSMNEYGYRDSMKGQEARFSCPK